MPPDALSSWWADVSAAQATLIAAAGLALVGSITIWQNLCTDRRDPDRIRRLAEGAPL